MNSLHVAVHKVVGECIDDSNKEASAVEGNPFKLLLASPDGWQEELLQSTIATFPWTISRAGMVMISWETYQHEVIGPMEESTWEMICHIKGGEHEREEKVVVVVLRSVTIGAGQVWGIGVADAFCRKLKDMSTIVRLLVSSMNHLSICVTCKSENLVSREGMLALMMGTHARLGAQSPLRCLEDGILQSALLEHVAKVPPQVASRTLNVGMEIDEFLAPLL